MKKTSLNSIVAVSVFALLPIIAFARAGGGGSSGGGGGGGFGGSHSSSFGGSSHASNGNASGSLVSVNSGSGFISFIFSILQFIFFILFVSFIFFIFYSAVKKARAAAIAKTDAEIATAVLKDNVWNKEKMIDISKGIFFTFQKAWGELDTATMEKILEPDMYKRIALELSVLNNEKRRNTTTIKQIIDAYIIGVHDDTDNRQDSFSVQFTAHADDELMDIENNKVIFSDNSVFTETWDFIRNGDDWQLASIHQATENRQSLITEISEFAKKNNFYYNPDFGWLMLPNKGVLFKDSRFGNTDINNHVIGYYRDKIVEFYTMAIQSGQNNYTNYLVAQAILPINYIDILVRRKHMLQFGPSGLRKHEMESNDFMKEFEVYSDEMDNVSAFELLAPNFMESIMKLPFELTIEVVGNTLYLSTKDTSADYEKMLEILSYAFDEMKM